jgi:mRNA interferase MazF
MKVHRGDVVLLSMPFAHGGGSKIRPALVVQNDQQNARLTNTIVVSIMRKFSRVHLATQLLVDPDAAGGRLGELV